MRLPAATIIKNARRVVLKIGSVLVTDQEQGKVRQDWLEKLADVLSPNIAQGQEWVIVSSGSIALGRKKLGIGNDKPNAEIRLEKKQAAASVGQITLAHAYKSVFEKRQVDVSQILLCPADTENRRSHLNARETINTLLTHKILPVINENDTITTDEIRFGDNDRLAARVAQMIGADLLIILSTTDGLYTDDPHINPDATFIDEVHDINDDIRKIAKDGRPGISTGGMKSKVMAAEMAVEAGCGVLIAQGESTPDYKTYERSTYFHPKTTSKNARKRWIGAHMEPKGIVIIDDGALQALRSGKSLLPVGVRSVEGEFHRGDVVTIKTLAGDIVARGISAYDADDAQKIAGKQSSDITEILGYMGRDALVHRDDMVVL